MNKVSELELPAELTLNTSAEIYGRGDLSLLQLQSDTCSAVISLQGAQLLSFIPTGKKDYLWLSPLAPLTAGTAIRGGIPVCAPWFGVNRATPELPKHGFVRNKKWQLVQAKKIAVGDFQLDFEYHSDTDDEKLYPQQFKLELSMRLGTQLQQTIRVSNLSDQVMPFSWALHNYFAVSAIADVQVDGLQQCEYLDATQAFQTVQQQGALTFNGEVDRVYQAVAGPQTLVAGGANTEAPLQISGEQCPTVICWNPGAVLGGKMTDVGGGFDDFVCIERGSAFADELQLPAAGVFEASQMIA